MRNEKVYILNLWLTSLHKNTPGTIGFTGKSYHALSGQISLSNNLFKKIKEGKIYSMSFYGHGMSIKCSHNLIPKPGKVIIIKGIITQYSL